MMNPLDGVRTIAQNLWCERCQDYTLHLKKLGEKPVCDKCGKAKE